ncbi:DUF1667 domain-containing protein [Arthrobacter sp. FW306-2-2C-D06B]|nr:DUF1667 domain-containing protein [Arthrobacter sp. FW306-2-2C-D06B]
MTDNRPHRIGRDVAVVRERRFPERAAWREVVDGIRRITVSNPVRLGDVVVAHVALRP